MRICTFFSVQVSSACGKKKTSLKRSTNKCILCSTSWTTCEGVMLGVLMFMLQVFLHIESERNVWHLILICRLLQGSECEVLFNYGDSNLSPGSNTSKWVTEERKLYMKKKLSKLKSTVEHLVEHINEPIIDKHVLREMHEHMGMMDRQIARFHDIVESNASKWRRNDALPQTQIGDKLPINLILPVTIDCFVDGFLIGVSVAISRKAGFILATANFFEMSFLGMAYASRLVKCTGASVIMRNLALYAPPVVMFFSAGLGAMLAATVRHIPVCFIAFVAFGVVALLFLVCNELLIEAKNAQGEDEKWWISICIFLGIYMVLIVNQILPEQ